MQKSFDGIFSESYDKTDAVIGGKEIVEGSTNGGRATVPAGLVEEIRALPEVEAAGGTVAPDEVNGADIIGDDGKAVAKESLGMSYDAANARFSPLRLKPGDWAHGDDQVVIDAGTAAKEDLGVGDQVVIATGGERAQLPDHRHRRLRRRRLARLRQHRRVRPPDRAARCSTSEGRYDTISIAAKSGTSPDELVAAITPLVPDQLEVKNGDAAGEGRRDGDQRGPEVRSGCSCSGSA